MIIFLGVIILECTNQMIQCALYVCYEKILFLSQQLIDFHGVSLIKASHDAEINLS